MIIDLRSDTVTKPSQEMLEAVMQANVGDDVYKEDETVNQLEERLAEMFGKEEALFFPTGTMANQAAIKLHTQPGEQVICDKYAHIYNYEGGGASFNSGVSCKLIDGHRGMFTANQVIASINPPDFYHSPLSTLVAIENTTNKGGGACWDFEELEEIKTICAEHGLGYHLDGAQQETTKDYGKVFDTISVCLSKGLGCPIGSVLIGDKTLMNGAMRVRKMFGGGMRQVGYLAAAGLYALDNNVKRLKEDHARAKEIGQMLDNLSFIKKVEPIETNIIIFELDKSIDEATFFNTLKEEDILIISMGSNKLRMVTHLDYSQSMHEVLLNVFNKKIRTKF